MVIETIRLDCGEDMSTNENGPSDAEYGEAEINEWGRLTIPKKLRDELQLDAGTTFMVVREGTDIRLVRELPELETLTSGKSREEWVGEAFRDAGEATFGGR